MLLYKTEHKMKRKVIKLIFLYCHWKHYTATAIVFISSIFFTSRWSRCLPFPNIDPSQKNQGSVFPNFTQHEITAIVCVFELHLRYRLLYLYMSQVPMNNCFKYSLSTLNLVSHKPLYWLYMTNKYMWNI